MIIDQFGVKHLFTDSLLSAILWSFAGGCGSKNSNADITWTSLLERKIDSLAPDEKQKHSLKRLKHLHQEKVLTNTTKGCVYFSYILTSLIIPIMYFIF